MSIRALLIWGAVALVLVVLFAALQGPRTGRDLRLLTYSEFLGRIEDGYIVSAQTREDSIVVTMHGRDAHYLVYVPNGSMPDAVRKMGEAGVSIEAVPARSGPSLGDILLGILPMLLLISAWYFFMRQMQAKGSGGADAP